MATQHSPIGNSTMALHSLVNEFDKAYQFTNTLLAKILRIQQEPNTVERSRRFATTTTALVAAFDKMDLAHETLLAAADPDNEDVKR